MQNKKGLSEIVATLIIILLTLVAVGIIWVVIRGVVTSGTNQIAVSADCTAINLNAVSVNETSAGVYNVILSRASGGKDISGIKVSILNASGVSSGPLDFGTLTALGQSSTTFTTNVTNGNSIEYTPFFNDASGNQQLCSNTQTFQF